MVEPLAAKLSIPIVVIKFISLQIQFLRVTWCLSLTLRLYQLGITELHKSLIVVYSIL